MVTPKVATTLGDALDRLDGAHLEGRALRWERSIRSRPAIAACIAINKRLTNQREDVLALWADRGHEFNAVNFATAIYQLGKRGRRELGRTAAYRLAARKSCSLVPACYCPSKGHMSYRKAPSSLQVFVDARRYRRLVGEATARFATDEGFGARELGNMAWGAAKLDVDTSVRRDLYFRRARIFL